MMVSIPTKQPSKINELQNLYDSIYNFIKLTELPLFTKKDFSALKDFKTGGQSKIKIATTLGFRLKVVIKLKNGRSELRSFMKEAKLMIKLKSHFIPKLVGFYEEKSITGNKILGMVIEFIDGFSLKELIDMEKRDLISISIDHKLFWILSLSDAISFLHSNNIIHLDLKPDNIIIDLNGFLKVIDLGVSSITDGSKICYIKEDDYSYSPYYVLPEAVHFSKHPIEVDGNTLSVRSQSKFGTEKKKKFKPKETLEKGNYIKISTKSDIWNLGLIFSELFSLASPWCRDSKEKKEFNQIVALLSKNFKYEVPKLCNEPALDRCLKSIVKRCVHYNQDLRPTSDQIRIKIVEALTTHSSFDLLLNNFTASRSIYSSLSSTKIPNSIGTSLNGEISAQNSITSPQGSLVLISENPTHQNSRNKLLLRSSQRKNPQKGMIINQISKEGQSLESVTTNEATKELNIQSSLNYLISNIEKLNPLTQTTDLVVNRSPISTEVQTLKMKHFQLFSSYTARLSDLDLLLEKQINDRWKFKKKSSTNSAPASGTCKYIYMSYFYIDDTITITDLQTRVSMKKKNIIKNLYSKQLEISHPTFFNHKNKLFVIGGNVVNIKLDNDLNGDIKYELISLYGEEANHYFKDIFSNSKYPSNYCFCYCQQSNLIYKLSNLNYPRCHPAIIIMDNQFICLGGSKYIEILELAKFTKEGLQTAKWNVAQGIEIEEMKDQSVIGIPIKPNVICIINRRQLNIDILELTTVNLKSKQIEKYRVTTTQSTLCSEILKDYQGREINILTFGECNCLTDNSSKCVFSIIAEVLGDFSSSSIKPSYCVIYLTLTIKGKFLVSKIEEFDCDLARKYLRPLGETKLTCFDSEYLITNYNQGDISSIIEYISL